MRERRRIRRTVVETNLIATVKKTVPARIVDISSLGVLVEVGAALRPLASCEVSIPVSGDTVRVRATVRRCRVLGPGRLPGGEEAMMFRAGLEFDGGDESVQARLESLWGGRGPRPVDAPTDATPPPRDWAVGLSVDETALRKLG
jgi:hypothetical protein